jgi:hypothetical protein
MQDMEIRSSRFIEKNNFFFLKITIDDSDNSYHDVAEELLKLRLNIDGVDIQPSISYSYYNIIYLLFSNRMVSDVTSNAPNMEGSNIFENFKLSSTVIENRYNDYNLSYNSLISRYTHYITKTHNVEPKIDIIEVDSRIKISSYLCYSITANSNNLMDYYIKQYIKENDSKKPSIQNMTISEKIDILSKECGVEWNELDTSCRYGILLKIVNDKIYKLSCNFDKDNISTINDFLFKTNSLSTNV